MRSKVAKKILEETPEYVKFNVREFANLVVSRMNKKLFKIRKWKKQDCLMRKARN